MWAWTKMVNGKKYSVDYIFPTKKLAADRAKRYRKTGFNAIVTQKVEKGVKGTLQESNVTHHIVYFRRKDKKGK